jgi:general secretion pathway protein L
MIAAFGWWWFDMMGSLVRDLIRPFGGARGELIVAIDAAVRGANGRVTGTILLRRDGRETPVQALDAPRQKLPKLPIGLRLPRGSMLSRQVVLPMAAGRDARALIGFELERLTPFTASEVLWDISRPVIDRVREKLNLNLSLVPREAAAAPIQALTQAGLNPSFIISEVGRIHLAVPLPAPLKALRTGLAGLCVVLACVALALPFWRQQAALADVARAIAADAPADGVAQALRRQLATAAAGRAAIARAQRDGGALPVLATLTNVLPDGTWISDLTLNAGDLTIDGQSTDAAALISLLSAAPGLHDPAFTAPITRTTDGTAELFALHAKASE